MFVTYKNAGPKVTPAPSFFTNDKALLLSHIKRTDVQAEINKKTTTSKQTKTKTKAKTKNHNTKLQGMHYNQKQGCCYL